MIEVQWGIDQVAGHYVFNLGPDRFNLPLGPVVVVLFNQVESTRRS